MTSMTISTRWSPFLVRPALGVALVLLSSLSRWSAGRGGVRALSFVPPGAKKGYYDRFRATCPADVGCVRRFDPTIVLDDDDDAKKRHCWVAVYRSSNNLPSVFLQDDFQDAMRLATTAGVVNNDDDKTKILTKEGNGDDDDDGDHRAPVAVARLRPADDENDESWLLDTLRCSLKKEELNPACDGGSEHTEALGVCVDELLRWHLEQEHGNVAGLRCKATLVSSPLFEARGFAEVTALGRDMATHACVADAALARYAARVVPRGADDDEDGVARSPGARDRALRILSLLGQASSSSKEETSTTAGADNDNNKEDDDDNLGYDPWASIKKYY